MHWQPSASLATLRHRARLLGTTRDFFDRQGMLEVETPALVEHAVTDPHLRNIGAQLGNGRRLFLHTSPEFHMKRLLAAGAPEIWQLCKVYRDGEAGRRQVDPAGGAGGHGPCRGRTRDRAVPAGGGSGG